MVDSHRAPAITEADAISVYRDLSPSSIEIGLDADGWRVGYRIKKPRVAGGGPRYLIDAGTGAILASKYHQ